MLINIRARHFHCSINLQQQFFHRTLITSYFFPVNIAKYLGAVFLGNTSRSSGLQMFFKLGEVFPVNFAKFLKTTFFSEHLRWLLLYFLKKWLNSYFVTSLWCVNNFFFPTHFLMYKKSNSFVYKFVVNFQVF